MPEPTNAAAPGADTEGGAVQRNHADNASLLGDLDFTRGRRRARLDAITRRHQAGRKLDAWGYATPTPERSPSDWLMSDAERTAYAHYLLEVEHWANWEVRLVLTPPGVRDRGPLGYTREQVNA